MADSTYQLPPETKIGHVHLKVSNLQQSIDFYCGVLGFELTFIQDGRAAFVSAGGYHHHIGLNVWYSENLPPSPKKSVGLFHTAILLPTRKDLARLYKQLKDANYPLTSAYDHGVSEALYLDDPDKNGVELYWDRPKEDWPTNEDGLLYMYSDKIDPEILLEELSL